MDFCLFFTRQQIRLPKHPEKVWLMSFELKLIMVLIDQPRILLPKTARIPFHELFEWSSKDINNLTSSYLNYLIHSPPTPIMMLRTALFQSLRCASRLSAQAYTPISRTVGPTTYVAVTRALPRLNVLSSRLYSASAGLGREEVEGRIMDIVKNFDKVSNVVRIQQREPRLTKFAGPGCKQGQW